MSRARNRPRRGPHSTPADVMELITGGPGTYAPSTEESITHPADLPGGKTHLANPQTIPVRPSTPGPRPQDYHVEHGVPPMDAGQYDLPTGWDETHARTEHPVPEPRVPDAVPVYQVQGPDDVKKLRRLIARNINVVAAGSDEPTRVCNADPDRVEICLLNEDSAIDVRFSADLSELSTTSAEGTGPAGNGAVLPHAATSYTRLRTQDEIFAIAESGTASVRLSVLIVTEGPVR